MHTALQWILGLVFIVIAVTGIILLSKALPVKSRLPWRVYFYPFLIAMIASVQVVFHLVFGDPIDWSQMVIHCISGLVTVEVIRAWNSDRDESK